MIDLLQIEYDRLVLEDETSDMSVEEAIEEWRILKKRMATMEKLMKEMNERTGELEGVLEAYVGREEGLVTTVDSALVEFKERKGRKNIAYAQAVKLALTKLNKTGQKVLNEAVVEFTKTGASSTYVKVSDPELQNFLADLTEVPSDELWDRIGPLERFPKNALRRLRKENIEADIINERVGEKIKNALSKFKNAISGFISKYITKGFNELDSIADELTKINDKYDNKKEA